jgi:hypothetical protein
VYFLIAAVNFEIHDFKYWRADWPTHSVQKTSVAFDDFGRWNNLIRKTPYAHKKKNLSAWRCIWRYHFQASVWNYRILNQEVKSQLFQIIPCFMDEKRIGVWNCHKIYWHRNTTMFTSTVHGGDKVFFQTIIIDFTLKDIRCSLLRTGNVAPFGSRSWRAMLQNRLSQLFPKTHGRTFFKESPENTK